MQPTIATTADTPHIYALLHDVRFHNLPSYSEAKPILEKSHALIVKDGSKVVIWASYACGKETNLDLVVAPRFPKHKITKGVSKYILAYGLNLSQDGRIVIQAYNPKGVKAALTVGFKMDEKPDRVGWTRLVLTREDFERKFKISG